MSLSRFFFEVIFIICSSNLRILKNFILNTKYKKSLVFPIASGSNHLLPFLPLILISSDYIQFDIFQDDAYQLAQCPHAFKENSENMILIMNMNSIEILITPLYYEIFFLFHFI